MDFRSTVLIKTANTIMAPCITSCQYGCTDSKVMALLMTPIMIVPKIVPTMLPLPPARLAPPITTDAMAIVS